MRSYLFVIAAFGTLILNGQFGAPQVLAKPLTGRPTCATTADIDNDGDLDVIATTLEDNALRWLRNNGNGTGFELIDISLSINEPISVLATDLDDDSWIDLVCVSSTDSSTVLFRALGSGIFSAPNVIGGPFDFQGASYQEGRNGLVQAADLNDDAYPELITCSGMELIVFANDGSTQIGAPVVLAELSSPSTAFATLDADGDGDNDIVIASDSLRTYLNDGDGSLSSVMVRPCPDGVTSIFAADADGDSTQDLFLQTQGGISLFLNNGSGDYLTTVSLAGFFSSWDVGDTDDDGDVDLLTTTNTEIPNSIPLTYLNQGSGTYGSGMASFDAAMPINVFSPGSSLLTDLTGDGTPDALLIDSEASGLWLCVGTGDGTFSSSDHLIVYDELNMPELISSADMDNDGDLDLVVHSNRHVVLLRNDGTGNFPERLLLGGEYVSSIRHLSISDVDNDLDLDVLSGSDGEGLRWFEQLDAGTFQEHILYPSYWNGTAAIVSDLNGDEHPEIVTWSYTPVGQGYEIAVLWNNGTQDFNMQVIAQTDNNEPPFYEPWLIDFDGDGDLDILANRDSEFFYFANDGMGSFSPAQVAFTGTGSVRTPDLNGDGLEDILVFGSEGTSWLENLGTGTWGPTTFIGPSAIGWKRVLTDFDLDGDVDILTRQVSYINSGIGTFTSSALPTVALSNDFTICDINSNGSQDLVFTTTGENRVVAILNHSTSTSRIEGTVYHDTDQNGTQDTGEQPLPWVALNVDPNALATGTTAEGSYVVYVDTGSYSISAQPYEPLWTTTSTAPLEANVTATNPLASGLDFGIAATVDTSIVVTTLDTRQFICGDYVSCSVTLSNLGTRIEQGQVRLELDPLFEFESSTTPPTSINGQTISWDFGSLGFFDFETFTVLLLSPDASHLGETWTHTAVVTLLDENGNIVSTETTTESETVSCAYDPNDKAVLPVGYGDAHAVDINTSFLDYTIRFQNTGTATATNLILSDRLDAELDPQRLQLLGSSHTPTSFQMNADRDLVVRFDNIQLPDSGADFTASQGFLLFRIGVAATAEHLDEITNSAAIIFDFNEPILTNTTRTTLVDCDLWDPTIAVLASEGLEATSGDAYQWFFNGSALPGQIGQQLFPNAAGSYSVEVTSSYGCTAISDPLISTDIPTPHASIRMVVVPNPFSDNARLVCSTPIPSNTSVELIDPQGRVLRLFHGNGSNEMLLHGQGLAPGLYFARLISPLPSKAIAVVVE